MSSRRHFPGNTSPLIWIALVSVCCLACGVFLAARALARQNASGGRAQQVEAGKKLYAANCVHCHGADGRGSGAPALRNTGLSRRAMIDVIADGKPETAMPAFKSRYDQQQIAELAAYVLSLSPIGGAGKRTPTPSAPAKTGSSELAADGASIYAARCAVCHEAGGPPFLNRNVLKAANPEYILYMLDAGTMHRQSSGLTAEQRIAVAEYVTGKSVAKPGAARTATPCAKAAPLDFSGPQWNGWGANLENSRFQPADQARLNAAQVPGLQLKWAFGFPGGFTSYSQPVVVGGRVFIGDPTGGVYSLDASSGCAYWAFHADAGVRTAITIGGNGVAYFGDLEATAYAVNATTGQLLWKRKISDQPYARITGSPRLYQGRLYVPVSSREEWMAADPNYPCCRFRGLLAALDAATGREFWRTYTIPGLARPTVKNKAGAQLWGPSGGGLWSSPTIDERRQVLYIGAGNNYSDPQTSMSDAMLAIDLKTGKILWSNQITQGDTYNVSCYRDDKSNCPAQQGPDSDFGAPPILSSLPNGKRVLIVSQKSGVIFGLDPDDQGKIVWQTRIGHGGPLGGVEWGSAADSRTVYVPLSDFGMTGGPEGLIPDPKAGGGLFALRLSDGRQMWSVSAPANDCTIPRCSPAQSAAVSAIPGVIFSGSDDGHMRAYSSSDGRILWDFDTVRGFKTVNQVPAHGGAIDGGGPAISGGMVFVSAGYGSLYGISGNVLLAFAPK
jgi:polyvinyl alcohol dehydrogenase (cytochrome)